MAGRGLASCGHFALNCSAESRNRSTGVSVADSPTWDMLPQLPSPRYQYRPNSGMAAQDRCPIPIYAIRLPKEPEGVLRYVHRPPFFFSPPALHLQTIVSCRMLVCLHACCHLPAHPLAGGVVSLPASPHMSLRFYGLIYSHSDSGQDGVHYRDADPSPSPQTSLLPGMLIVSD
jgi:hypothetical protein